MIILPPLTEQLHALYSFLVRIKKKKKKAEKLHAFILQCLKALSRLMFSHAMTYIWAETKFSLSMDIALSKKILGI